MFYIVSIMLMLFVDFELLQQFCHGRENFIIFTEQYVNSHSFDNVIRKEKMIKVAELNPLPRSGRWSSQSKSAGSSRPVDWESGALAKEA